jgi:hypothetical protein
VLSLVAPTAMQSTALEQETPARDPPRPGGTAWTLQTLPFQRSASATPTPDALTSYPTAVHALVAVQDTAAKAESEEPGIRVVGWIVHDVPFQVCAIAI